MRTKHSMRKRLQQVLLSTYLRKHNTYPILVLPFVSRRRRSSQGTHTLIKFLIMIQMNVVYEQGVGLKSSITADMAFRNDLPCRGVPTVHYRRRMLAHLSQLLPITGNHFMIYFGETQKDIIPLATTKQSALA